MSKTLHKIYVGLFFVVGISVTILLIIDGYSYYNTPEEERMFLSEKGEIVYSETGEALINPKHNLLKPSGPKGHGYGIIGTLMMITGVSVYMIRKRTKWFGNFGYLKHWLEFHIFLCATGPILVLFHTAFKFGGIVAVSFWSMVAVVISGVIGRFIYVQIPRTIQGQEMDIKELNEMSEGLENTLKDQFLINENVLARLDKITTVDRYKKISLGASLIFVLKDNFGIKNVLKQMKKDLNQAGLTKLQKKEILRVSKAKLLLARRVGLLRTTQKLFNYWHIFHLPFAIAMFVIMVIHVGVTIAFGYKWIF
jgi:hypothetical protein